MRSPTLAAILGFALWLGAGESRGQTVACDKLNPGARVAAAKLLARLHPYDGCDQSFSACLKQQPVPALVRRLADNLCRRVAAGQDSPAITHWLSRRAQSLLPGGPKAAITLADVPMAGDPRAPLVVVEYACARCPYCAKLTPWLKEAVERGDLQGKARLYLKLYPNRDHAFSREAALAFLAAQRLGKFWEYAAIGFREFQQFSPSRLPEWAGQAGLDRAAFESQMKDPALEQALLAIKKEGILLKVDATPTLVIDGRRYLGDLSQEELLDVLQEAAEAPRPRP